MERWERVAREEIRLVLAAHTQVQDSSRFREVIEYYADDAMLEIAGTEPRRVREALAGSVKGADSRAAQGERRVSLHHVSSPLIIFDSTTEAHSFAYFLNLRADGIDHWGRYRDDFVKTNERWLIRHRFAHIDGRASGSWAPPPPPPLPRSRAEGS